MFRKLKDKIAEEVRQSPIRLPTTVQSLGQTIQQQISGTPSEDEDKSVKQSNDNTVVKDLISLADGGGNETTPNCSQFSIDEEDTFDAKEVSSTVEVADSNQAFRSSTPISKNDTMHDAALLPIYSSPNMSYNLQSDIESTHSEMEDSFNFQRRRTSSDVDQMLAAFNKLKNRLTKYKSKYSEVVLAYKEVHEENNKIKLVLSDSQDKALRRISELREQSQLGQKAKMHLEENLRITIEEKDQLISVLQTQVKLLKDGGSVESLNDSSILVDVSEDQKSDEVDELKNYKEKVKRLETLLSKCKDTIKNHKERNQNLTKEKDSISKELEEKMSELQNYQQSSEESLNQLRKELENTKERLNRMSKQEEEEAIGIAETKRQMHVEMEGKDNTIKELKVREKILTEEKENWKRTEAALEDEKQNLIQELSRGKAAAVTLLKQEEERKIKSLKEEYEQKIQTIKMEHETLIQKKNEDLEDQMMKLKEDLKSKVCEKEKEMELAIEERELQKMAALSQQDNKTDELIIQIENMKTHELELNSRVEALKQDIANERQNWIEQIEENRLRHIEELKNLENQKCLEIDELKSNSKAQMEDSMQRLLISHNEEMEKVKKEHEEVLLSASNDLEKSLLEQIELVKIGHQQSSEESLNKISELELKNKEYLSEVELTKESLSELQTEHENLQSNEQKLLVEIDDYKRKQEELLVQNNEYNAKLHAQNDEKASVDEKIEDIQKERKDLEVNYNNLLDESNEARKLNETLTAEVNSLKESLMDLEKSFDEKLETSKNEVSTLEEEKSNLMSEVTELRSQSSESNKILQDKLTEHEKTLEESLHLKSQIEELSSSKVALDRTCEELQKQNEDLSRKCGDLESNVESLKSSSDEKFISVVNELDATRQNMHIVEDRLSEVVKNSNAIKEDFTLQIEEYEEKITELTRIEEQLQIQIKEKETSFEEYCQKLSDSEKAIGELMEEKAQIESKLSATENLLEESSSNLQAKQKEYDEFKQSSEQQLLEISNECKDFEMRMKDSLAENSSLKEEIESSKEKFSELEAERDSLKETNANLSSDLSTNGEHCSKLENELIQLQSKLSELNSQLDEKIKDGDSFSTLQNEKESKIRELEARIDEKVDKNHMEMTNLMDFIKKALQSLENGEEISEENVELFSCESQALIGVVLEFIKKINLEKDSLMKSEASFKESFSSLQEHDTESKKVIENLQSQITNLKNDVTHSAEQKQEFEQREVTLHQTINQLETRVEHIDELQTKLQNCEKVIEESGAIHRENIENIEALHKEKEALLVKEFEEKVNNFQQSLSDQGTELKTKEAEINELKSSLDFFKNDIERLNNENSALDEKLKSSVKEIGELNCAINSSNEELSGTLSLKITELQEKEREIDVISKEKMSFMSELDDLRKKCEEFDDELKSKCKENLDLKSVFEEKIGGLENERDELQNNQKLHVDELTNLKDLLEEANSKLKVSSQEVKKAKEESQTKLQDLKKRAEIKLSQIKKQLQNEKQEAISNLQNRIDDLNKEMTLISETHKAELQKTSEEHESNAKVEEDKLELARDEIKSLEDRLKNLATEMDEKCSEQLSEINLLSDQKTRLEKELGNLKEAHMLAYGSTALEDQHNAEMDALKEENTFKLDQMEIEHQKRLKVIIKEFTQRIEKKDKEYEDMLTQAINKGSQGETVMLQEHEKEIKELNFELEEKTKAIEEVREYYHGWLKEKEEALQTRLDDMENNVAHMKTSMLNMEKEKNVVLGGAEEKSKQHEKEKAMLVAEHLEEMAELEYKFQQDSKHLLEDQENKFKEKMTKMTYTQQHDDLGASFYDVDISNGDAQERTLEKQSQLAMSVVESGTESAELLRRQIISQSQEMDDLRTKHQSEIGKLREEIDLLRQNGLNNSNSNVITFNDSKASYVDNSLPEITEFEYLKNVMFEYLMGKETMTMIKVISAVLKFTDEQTKRILEKEEARQSLVSQFIGSS